MLDTVLSRAAWASSSSCPSTLLKKLFMVMDSDLQKAQDGGQSEHSDNLSAYMRAHRAHLGVRSCSQPGDEGED